MISLLGSEELKTYPLNYMTAVIDTIADNNDVNILLIIFQSKSMMLKLFWQLQALNPGQNIFWFTWVIWDRLLVY
jgi:heptosyltransferase-2